MLMVKEINIAKGATDNRFIASTKVTAFRSHLRLSSLSGDLGIFLV